MFASGVMRTQEQLDSSVRDAWSLTMLNKFKIGDRVHKKGDTTQVWIIDRLDDDGLRCGIVHSSGSIKFIETVASTELVPAFNPLIN
jgi:hypothetical protein